MANATTQVRVCRYCQRTLPIDAFRRRLKDRPERHTQCNTCNAQELRERREAKKKGKLYQFAKDVLDARRDRNRVIRLTHDLFGVFGTSAEIAAEWRSVYDAARAKGRHMIAAKMLTAIPELLVVTEQLRGEQQRDLESLTDRELTQLVEQQRCAVATQLSSNHS